MARASQSHKHNPKKKNKPDTQKPKAQGERGKTTNCR